MRTATSLRTKELGTLRTAFADRVISLATSAAVGKRQYLHHATHLYPIVAPPPYVELLSIRLSGHLLVCIAS